MELRWASGAQRTLLRALAAQRIGLCHALLDAGAEFGVEIR